MENGMILPSFYNSISVRAIIRRGDTVLVEWLESKGISFLLGGTVEGDEDLLETLRRELNEEVEGAVCGIGSYRGSIGHWWKVEGEWNGCLNHFYEVKLDLHGDVVARERGRCLRWLSLGDVELPSLQPPRLKSLLLESQGSLWNYVDVSE